MSKFVVVYTGGAMAATEAEQQQAMAAWGAWFAELGDAVADMGTPFAGSTNLAADGVITMPGGSSLTGYSIIEADSLETATTLAKGCPVLANGGSAEVYETISM